MVDILISKFIFSASDFQQKQNGSMLLGRVGMRLSIIGVMNLSLVERGKLMFTRGNSLFGIQERTALLELLL